MGSSGLNIIANRIKRLTAAFFILTLLFQLISCDDYGVLYTESIEDYNTEKYSVRKSFYLDSIPENATVVSFSYYEYWNESSDVYLELRFSTVQELEEHLFSVKNHVKSSLVDYPVQTVDGEWLLEVDNPYNDKYVDLFCLDYVTFDKDGDVTGYSIEFKPNYTLYRCNYGVISYSLEELTVIQSSAVGSFEYFEEAYVPKYFRRFNIPTDEEFERIYYVEY